MAGLVPAIHVFEPRTTRHKARHDVLTGSVLCQPFKQILPVRILRVNETHFPRPRPMLDGFFALNCGPDVVMVFEIDKAFERVPLGETVNQAFAVCVDTRNEIACNAGIENTVTTIGHDVDETGHEEFKIGRCFSAVVRRMDETSLTTSHVMAGLVPAIHVLLSAPYEEDVDARDKRGHDERGATPGFRVTPPERPSAYPAAAARA
jgi:hypothetical protein